ncbi:MAG: factor-independent urate hydroxylase [Gemmatimonadaceae bacterium]
MALRTILAANNYGKSAIRVVKVTRSGLAGRHELSDVTVGVQFEGEYESVHRAGDNSVVLPTDTMKNTVYALAGKHLTSEIETFGLALANHFLVDNDALKRVRVDIDERPWQRMTVGGSPHAHAFTREGAEQRLCRVVGTREGRLVESGIQDLLILKTSLSAFEGYLSDRYTTLRETRDRLLATVLNVTWRYSEADAAFARCRTNVRRALLETFANHDSHSVQHTAFAMGEAALTAAVELKEIRLSLPNKHHLLVDLAPFGLQNRNEIFVPADEPHGLIEVTVRRDS